MGYIKLNEIFLYLTGKVRTHKPIPLILKKGELCELKSMVAEFGKTRKAH